MSAQGTKKKSTINKSEAFEDVLGQLEQLVQSLEEGELPLEKSLEAFEAGVGLARRAQAKLDNMERRIEKLTEEGLLEPMESDSHDGDN